MPNAKLGLLIFWPSFWTGFPIKLAFCLLLLAAHVHPWEGSGFFMLMLVSIPIDIWAIGLCARTVFIDRLKIDPPSGLGFPLWLRWAVFSAVALPVIKMAVSAVAAGAKSVTSSVVERIKEGVYPALPVAEQISLELVMWGSVATVVLLILLYGWLYGLGWLTQPFVKSSKPLDGTVEDRTQVWDFLRIPADQPLLLTSFTGVGVVLILIFWGLLPASTPHPHPEYEFINPPQKVVKIDPNKVLTEAEQVVAKAELVVEKLEKEKSEGGADESNGKGKGKPSSSGTDQKMKTSKSEKTGVSDPDEKEQK